MRKLLLKILPAGVIDFYKKNKSNRKQKHRNQLEKSNRIITEEEVIEQLQLAGIKEGEVVMLHSALSKIGFVKEGAQAIIQAFIKVIGTEGTLMMPSFPAIGFNYNYLKTNPVFDSKHTPSKMGVITETFRNMKGVERSLHPTDAVCAFGKQAVYLTKDHVHQLTPYNKNSPFYRLSALDGKIVLIGVDLNSLTNLHTLEDAVENFEYPVYHQTIFNTTLINDSGQRIEMQTKVHDPLYSKKRKCNELMPQFEKAGFLKHFKLGSANCIIIDAGAMHQWMVENYGTKGITMYTPHGK